MLQILLSMSSRPCLARKEYLYYKFKFCSGGGYLNCLFYTKNIFGFGEQWKLNSDAMAWDCQKWLNFFCRTQKKAACGQGGFCFQWAAMSAETHDWSRDQNKWHLRAQPQRGHLHQTLRVQGTSQKRSKENTRARGRGGELWDATFQTQHRHYTTMNSQPPWLFVQDLHKIESIWWGGQAQGIIHLEDL